jgi:hypothetical protein
VSVALPHLQLGLPGSRMKVLISGQNRQVVTDAQLCEQGINGSNLWKLKWCPGEDSNLHGVTR